MRRLFLLLIVLVPVVSCERRTSVSSPDGKLTLCFDRNDCSYSLTYDDVELLSGSSLQMTLAEGGDVLCPEKISRLSISSGNVEHIAAPFYRQKEFDYCYNSLVISLKGGFSLEWRISDDGVAYRFSTKRTGETVVKGELALFRFPEDHSCTMACSPNRDNPFKTSFEAQYITGDLSGDFPSPAFVPVSVDCGGGLRVTVAESAVKDYPGMFLSTVPGDSALKSVFAPYPATTDKHPWRDQLYVTSYEDYIAKSTGARNYPWRIIKVTTDDLQLPVDNLVYALAEPSHVEDTSWIKPGFSAWEWWNDWGLRGVDFKPGINVETYKYYIDFAADFGLDYMILDEGWYPTSEGRILEPLIDVGELVKYASARGVGIILWAVFNTVDEHLEETFSKYSEMGVAGFKIDFLDRNDQTAYEMIWRIAEAASRYRLVLDYHGIFPPCGFNRTFPHVLNFEGVYGLENCKWETSDDDHPGYDATIPYLRQMVGYCDYTPGAMHNVHREGFVCDYSHPSSMGTRSHQLALYVVLDSPLTMLCDTPSNYYEDVRTTSFIASLPRSYESKKVIAGKLGEYVVVARENDGAWYVAGLTGSEGRNIDFKLDFLPEGRWWAELYCDSRDSDTNAESYDLKEISVSSGAVFNVRLSRGGGFLMKINKDTI